MILHNARAVLKDGVKKVDISIENGKIKKIASAIKGEGIDLGGLTVLPGLIDMHVHLREPGFEKKENIESGCRAAVKGGLRRSAACPTPNP